MPLSYNVGDKNDTIPHHLEGPLICGDIRRSTENAVLDDTVGVDRQQLHTLWQDELASRGRAGTILTITRQDLGALGHEVFSHRLGVTIQAASDSCGGEKFGIVHYITTSTE